MRDILGKRPTTIGLTLLQITPIYAYYLGNKNTFYTLEHCFLLFYHRIGDGDIMLIFYSGFQLAIGKKGRFLYVFDRPGSQPAPGRPPAIARGVDIV